MKKQNLIGRAIAPPTLPEPTPMYVIYTTFWEFYLDIAICTYAVCLACLQIPLIAESIIGRTLYSFVYFT